MHKNTRNSQYSIITYSQLLHIQYSIITYSQVLHIRKWRLAARRSQQYLVTLHY